MNWDPENECDNCGEWKSQEYDLCYNCFIEEKEKNE